MMNTDNQDYSAQGEVEPQDTESSFRKAIESVNLAEDLDEEKLKEIGSECLKGYQTDKDSRDTWENQLDEWLLLANQYKEEKSFPWPDASNVKYPLLTTAAMQFAARAYPSLVPSNGQVVKAQVIGKDTDGAKLELATRVSSYMSYQVMHEMTYWEEDMDKMLIQLPIVGTMFKKTYWDFENQVPASKLISPKNLIVNYWAPSLLEAERISEEFLMSPRVLQERKNAKIFLDVDLGRPVATEKQNGVIDDTSPYELVEQHTFLHLDDDDYKEPYIVTFEKHTGKVLRISARFEADGVSVGDGGAITKIKPIQYYTKFGFIPNPDGSFYDIGFGCLLGPLNESVNTLINQLIDAGTLNNLQSGFLGKGLRLRMGEQAFSPGEWKFVNSTGDDLKKQIVPLPSKEPSNVLFQLMGSLITSGKELASVAEIFTGKMPGQNTPATTTMATIEQGMKVFTAVYKRIFRSLAEEFKKLYDLNKNFLNPNTYAEVVDVPIGPDDFGKTYDICPGADPTAVSQTEKLMKAQGLLELLPLGALDPIAVLKRVLEAQEQPNYEQLFVQQVQQTGQLPPPPPDPKLQEMQMKGQLEQKKIAMQGQAQQHKMELESRGEATKLAMKAAEHQQDMAHKEQLNKIQSAEAVHKQRIFSAEAQAKMVQGLTHREVEHQQKMRQGKQQATLKKEKPKK